MLMESVGRCLKQHALKSEAVGTISVWGSGGLSRSSSREESLKSQQKVVVSFKDRRGKSGTAEL